MPDCAFMLFKDLVMLGGQPHQVSLQHPHAECCHLSETVRVSVTRKQRVTTPGLIHAAQCQPPGHWKELQSSDDVLISKVHIAFARLAISHKSRRTERRRPLSSH